MGRVIHFEIQASKPEALVDFYGALFGWHFHKWDGPMPYWLIKTGADGTPGIDGGLLLRQGPVPTEGASVNAFVCTVGVDDLDASLGKVTALKAPVVVPKMAVPGIGWLAYAKDPDGNIFGMLQADTAAK